MAERDDMAREREALRAEFGDLYDEVSALLFDEDPIGINFDTNTDEYEPEVGTILPRLSGCGSSSDVAHVVHEEFMRWFGSDSAGPVSRYETIGSVIWQLWSQYPHENQSGQK